MILPAAPPPGVIDPNMALPPPPMGLPGMPSTDPAALMQLLGPLQEADKAKLAQQQADALSAVAQIRGLNPALDQLGAHGAPGIPLPPAPPGPGTLGAPLGP